MIKFSVIIQNSIILTVSEILNKVMILIFFFIVARYLGPLEFGILSFALSFTSIFEGLLDFGQNQFMVREISKDNSFAIKYFSNFFIFRIVILSLYVSIIFIIINLIGFSQEKIYTIYFSSFFLVFNSLSNIAFSIFRSFERMSHQAISLIIRNSTILAGGFICTYFSLNIVQISMFYSLAGLCSFLYSYIILLTRFIKPKFRFDYKFLINSAKVALPLTFTSIYRFSFNADIIILSFIANDVSVGIYNGAFKIISTFQFIPLMLSYAIFPVLSRSFHTNPSQLQSLIDKYIKIMFLLCLPLGFSLPFVSKEIILLLLGSKYQSSSTSLAILSFFIIALFLRYPFQYLLIATNKEKKLSIIIVLSIIFGIISSSVLTYYFDYIGTSISRVITEFFFLFLCFYFSIKMSVFKLSTKLKRNIFKIFLSSLLLTIFLFFLTKISFFMLNVITLSILALIALVFYGALLLISGVVKIETIRLMKKQ